MDGAAPYHERKTNVSSPGKLRLTLSCSRRLIEHRGAHDQSQLWPLGAGLLHDLRVERAKVPERNRRVAERTVLPLLPLCFLALVHCLAALNP